MNPAETVARVLDRHRWKSMGVSSVECECGEVIHATGQEPLAQFPADEAFRRHVADEAVAALGLREDDSEEGDLCPNCVTPWKCNGPHLIRYVTDWQEVTE